MNGLFLRWMWGFVLVISLQSEFSGKMDLVPIISNASLCKSYWIVLHYSALEVATCSETSFFSIRGLRVITLHAGIQYTAPSLPQPGCCVMAGIYRTQGESFLQTRQEKVDFNVSNIILWFIIPAGKCHVIYFISGLLRLATFSCLFFFEVLASPPLALGVFVVVFTFWLAPEATSSRPDRGRSHEVFKKTETQIHILANESRLQEVSGSLKTLTEGE